MYVKDGVTYASGDEYADMLCARGEAEMYAQSSAIAGHEMALAQAEAMIERLRSDLALAQGQRDASNREIERLRDENAGLRKDAERWRATRAEHCNVVWCAIGAGECGRGLDAAIDAAMQEGE